MKLLIFEDFFSGHTVAINQHYIICITAFSAEKSVISVVNSPPSSPPSTKVSEYTMPVEFRKLTKDLEGNRTVDYSSKNSK